VLAIKVFIITSLEVFRVLCFTIKGVSTYNFEVGCVFKIGAVILTNTLSAFKSPPVVYNPVKVFAEASFAVESNTVYNPSVLAIVKSPPLIVSNLVKIYAV
jgi:hypothetical protein